MPDHLPCGFLPFHAGVCRYRYLSRRDCEACPPLNPPAVAVEDPSPAPEADESADADKPARKR